MNTIFIVVAFSLLFSFCDIGIAKAGQSTASFYFENIQSVERDIDRPGMDYRSFDIATPNIESGQGECHQACQYDMKCRACTYVKPGIQGPKARCWLKSGAPNKVPNTCCISYIFSDDISSEPNIDRGGMDYSNFDLDRASPDKCKSACRSDDNCKAYTYVKPGIQGPNARCWLKNSVPNATPSNCCTSGVKTRRGM